MNQHQHPSNNDVLGAPKGWDQDEVPCRALPITRVSYDGIAAVMSYWKPTADELAMLNAGGSVALSIIGTTMPPVMLAVDPA
ncbi:hypothetical protein [Duganella violaceipulchra]|uniref:Uncharacterized protein n=1 Tax=Duganella violaceipulchra TaxID=2849652 RepID=A0AA41HBN7_9BURK|nr:hypothetical protein [Duganella violaceicalia]MBV6321917.1 hypothetical protein [Duganella violaceicalia]MCP2007089.1 hypothetical protein [Duganella violaceicalia]